MKKKIIESWTHPVWSKVFATGIISAITFIFFMLKSNNDLIQVWHFLINCKVLIPIWTIFLIAFLAIGLLSYKTRTITIKSTNLNKQSFFYNRLINSRLSTAVSFDANLNYPDNQHHYLHIFRHDYLINKNNYISVRQYSLLNSSLMSSNFIIHTETLESKIFARQIKILAINTTTKKTLRVENISSNNKELFHDFKIYFDTILKPGETFNLCYAIILREEANSFEHEIDLTSICFNRYKKGVGKLDFSVSFNTQPKTVYMESMNEDGQKNLLENKVIFYKFEPDDLQINILKENLPANEYIIKKEYDTINFTLNKIDKEILIINYKH